LTGASPGQASHVNSTTCPSTTYPPPRLTRSPAWPTSRPASSYRDTPSSCPAKYPWGHTTSTTWPSWSRATATPHRVSATSTPLSAASMQATALAQGDWVGTATRAGSLVDCGCACGDMQPDAPDKTRASVAATKTVDRDTTPTPRRMAATVVWIQASPTRGLERLSVVAARSQPSRPSRRHRLSVVRSTEGELERETGLEPATFSLEGLSVYAR